MKILMISGLSGAGKSKAASFLEDMGFYIVDNMPAGMILKFAEFCAAGSGRYNRVALVYDVRTAKNFDEFLEVLETRADRYNQNREELFQAEKDGKLFLYRPKNTEGFSRTEKDQEKIRALYQNGYDDAKARWDEMMAYLSE